LRRIFQVLSWAFAHAGVRGVDFTLVVREPLTNLSSPGSCRLEHLTAQEPIANAHTYGVRLFLIAHHAVFSQRSMRRFETTLRRAIPKGHNLHLPRSTASRSTTYVGLLSAFVTHSII
jgi:hypothetical protein